MRPWRENLLPQSSHPVYMEESEESEEDDEEEEESSGGDFFSMGSQSSTSTSSNPFSTDHHITALRRVFTPFFLRDENHLFLAFFLVEKPVGYELKKSGLVNQSLWKKFFFNIIFFSF